MNIFMLLLLIFAPLLTFCTENKEAVETFTSDKMDCKFEHSYYPNIDYDSAYELYIIKRNYHRYSNKLKTLANQRIQKIKNKKS